MQKYWHLFSNVKILGAFNLFNWNKTVYKSGFVLCLWSPIHRCRRGSRICMFVLSHRSSSQLNSQMLETLNEVKVGRENYISQSAWLSTETNPSEQPTAWLPSALLFQKLCCIHTCDSTVIRQVFTQVITEYLCDTTSPSSLLGCKHPLGQADWAGEDFAALYLIVFFPQKITLL